MGKAKNRWTSEEETAFLAGVEKHGTGKWKNIRNDPQFAHCLINRTNVHLKDKWRNIISSNSSNGRVAPPRSSPHKQPGSSQIWRMVIATVSKTLCQVIMIAAIVTVLGFRIQTLRKLPLLLIVRFLWLVICYITKKLVKMWKDFKRFLKSLW